MMTKYQKRIRLKDFNYIGCYRYYVTICANKKNKFFAREKVVDLCAKILRDTAEEFSFDVWAYCFMPDHLHLLVEGRDDDSDFRKLMSVFKQKTGYHVKQSDNVVRGFSLANNCGRLWQENYFERVLRNDEGTIEVMKYILNNPVRKKLVSDCLNYPYIGSFKEDLKCLL